MPPYPLTPSKDMLPLEYVDRSNKRQKLEETYLSLEGMSSIFSIKDGGAGELPSYEWTYPQEYINVELDFEEIPASGSTENNDDVFTMDTDISPFQETTSVENPVQSRDLIDDDSSSEAVCSTENNDDVFTIDTDISRFQETTSVENPVQSRDLIDDDSSSETFKEMPDSTMLEESTDDDDEEEEIPWLDFVARYDADGKECRKEDIPARKVEITEELEMISQKVQQMKKDARKQEELSLLKHPKKAVQKLKVDCPHCQKKVAAVRFVPHLSKCFGNGGRKCTRQ